MLHNQLRNDYPAKSRWVGLAVARPFAGRWRNSEKIKNVEIIKQQIENHHLTS